MKQLLILSGKGGTGKTTVAGALIKLASVKAYADCDVDAPNLHLISEQKVAAQKSDYYGLPKAQIFDDKCIGCGLCQEKCRFGAIFFDGRYHVDNYACEGCGVCELVCPVDATELDDAIAGELMLYHGEEIFSTAKLKMGSGTSGMLVSRVKKQMNEIAGQRKVAIIDGSPGIGCPVIASLSGVDTVLLVSEPSISGISDMERIVKTAQHFGVEILVCVNKFDINLTNTKKIENYCVENNLAFVGTIPYDTQAVKAINAGKTIVDIECKSGKAVKEIYKNISILQNTEV